MSDWISVKDRLPEKEIDVLIYVPLTDKYMYYCVVAEYYWKDGNNAMFIEKDGTHCPTHWMPLPDPPKE